VWGGFHLFDHDTTEAHDVKDWGIIRGRRTLNPQESIWREVNRVIQKGWQNIGPVDRFELRH
jgi:hypothetical protein